MVHGAELRYLLCAESKIL